MKTTFPQIVATAVLALVIVAAGAGLFVYSGIYNIGADDHHTRPVYALLRTVRERSIAVRSSDLVVPDLTDKTLILKGAGQYAAMCTQCHLSPLMKDSEIRPGLYPQPPNLARVRIDPKAAFWAIKHGIKMSAMPAWGGSHDDATIWSMVAFLQTLPDLSPAQYKDIVARAPPDDDMGMDDGEAPESGSGATEKEHSAANEHHMSAPAHTGTISATASPSLR